MGKDTTIGHWELAGHISPEPMPTFPEGFPQEVLDAFSEATGRGVLCNRPYSGTQVIQDYGREHMETGKWIVYTSADSVFQLAAHEQVVPLEELYEAYVPAETRAYLDARCRPDRDRRRRPAASKATQMQKEEATDGDH